VSARESAVLINPPSPAGATANREGAAGLGYLDHSPQGFYYPPQTIAYVGAVLRQEGWQVRALDAVAQRWSIQDVLASIRQGREAVIGVFVSYDTLRGDIEFLQALKAEIPHCSVIVFGPATRYVQKELGRTNVDGILLGEPERSFSACRFVVATSVASDTGGRLKSPLRTPAFFSPQSLGVPGYDEEGYIQGLDSLPYPAWDLLPYVRYRFLTVMGSRGCGDYCRYCPYVATQGNRFRARSPESIVGELAWLAEEFRPGRVVFRDPVFAWDRERVVDLCQGILAARLHLRWECESRPEHFDEALLRLMKRAGCEGIKIGLETTSGPLLHKLRRIETVEAASAYREHVAALVRICLAIGLRCRVFVMLGLPGQEQSAAQETLDWLEKIRPSALNIKLFQAYPGIRLSAEEIKAAIPPDEATLEVFLQVQKRLESGSGPKRGMLQEARGWLRRRIGGEAE